MHQHSNYMSLRRRRKKKKKTEIIFEEIIVENYPNMGKEIISQVQEVQRVPYRIKPRRNRPRHILITLLKIKYKEKILKAAGRGEFFSRGGVEGRICSKSEREVKGYPR